MGVMARVGVVGVCIVVFAVSNLLFKLLTF